MREPQWGELQSRRNYEAYVIWSTRHEEPEPMVVDTLLLGNTGSLDDEIDAKAQYAALEQRLMRRDFYVLHCYSVLGMSFREIGETLDLTVERVRQIHARAILRARQAIEGQESQ